MKTTLAARPGHMRLLGQAAAAACFLAGWLGTGTAAAQSMCDQFGGTVDANQMCQVHTVASTYKQDFSFPTDYPDQQPLTDFLTQRRDEWADYAQENPPRGKLHYLLAIAGKTYRSGTPDSGTQSVVLAMNSDFGAHPVSSYKTFNYDIGKHAPITFDTLFKPGTDPIAVLAPIVQGELGNRGETVDRSVHDPSAYQNFAITDDAAIFFFNQGQLLAQVDGPLQVSIPRAKLASLLA
jgi:hypothetical protein